MTKDKLSNRATEAPLFSKPWFNDNSVSTDASLSMSTNNTTVYGGMNSENTALDVDHAEFASILCVSLNKILEKHYKETKASICKDDGYNGSVVKVSGFTFRFPAKNRYNNNADYQAACCLFSFLKLEKNKKICVSNAPAFSVFSIGNGCFALSVINQTNVLSIRNHPNYDGKLFLGNNLHLIFPPIESHEACVTPLVALDEDSIFPLLSTAAATNSASQELQKNSKPTVTIGGSLMNSTFDKLFGMFPIYSTSKNGNKELESFYPVHLLSSILRSTNHDLNYPIAIDSGTYKGRELIVDGKVRKLSVEAFSELYKKINEGVKKKPMISASAEDYRGDFNLIDYDSFQVDKSAYSKYFASVKISTNGREFFVALDKDIFCAGYGSTAVSTLLPSAEDVTRSRDIDKIEKRLNKFYPFAGSFEKAFGEELLERSFKLLELKHSCQFNMIAVDGTVRYYSGDYIQGATQTNKSETEEIENFYSHDGGTVIIPKCLLGLIAKENFKNGVISGLRVTCNNYAILVEILPEAYGTVDSSALNQKKGITIVTKNKKRGLMGKDTFSVNADARRILFISKSGFCHKEDKMPADVITLVLDDNDVISGTNESKWFTGDTLESALTSAGRIDSIPLIVKRYIDEEKESKSEIAQMYSFFSKFNVSLGFENGYRCISMSLKKEMMNIFNKVVPYSFDGNKTNMTSDELRKKLRKDDLEKIEQIAFNAKESDVREEVAVFVQRLLNMFEGFRVFSGASEMNDIIVDYVLRYLMAATDRNFEKGARVLTNKFAVLYRGSGLAPLSGVLRMYTDIGQEDLLRTLKSQQTMKKQEGIKEVVKEKVVYVETTKKEEKKGFWASLFG